MKNKGYNPDVTAPILGGSLLLGSGIWYKHLANNAKKNASFVDRALGKIIDKHIENYARQQAYKSLAAAGTFAGLNMLGYGLYHHYANRGKKQ